MIYILIYITDTSLKYKNKIINESNNNNVILYDDIDDEEQQFIQTMNNIPLQLLGDTEGIHLKHIHSIDLITTLKLEYYTVKNNEYHLINPNVCIDICIYNI